MQLDYKPLESLDEADLKALVTNQVSEWKFIEYKEQLPTNADSSRKDFLGDVSSFANASGGHLVYGMREKSGVPVALLGLPGINPDSEILRLESMTRDGIDPRIPGIMS